LLREDAALVVDSICAEFHTHGGLLLVHHIPPFDRRGGLGIDDSVLGVDITNFVFWIGIVTRELSSPPSCFCSGNAGARRLIGLPKP